MCRYLRQAFNETRLEDLNFLFTLSQLSVSVKISEVSTCCDREINLSENFIYDLCQALPWTKIWVFLLNLKDKKKNICEYQLKSLAGDHTLIDLLSLQLRACASSCLLYKQSAPLLAGLLVFVEIDKT